MDPKQRAIINRNNARKSTGPKTQAGKDKSRFNALDHGLCSRNIINIENDRVAFESVKASYEGSYDPQTLPEKETLIRMVETQWQLTRVARLIDLAFTNGGDLMTTSKMTDNFSRHQTRLHRMHMDLVRRMDSLIAQRDPDSDSDEYLDDSDLPVGAGHARPDAGPDATAGHARPDDDASAAAPPAEPEIPEHIHPKSPSNENNRNDLHEIGFVLNSAAKNPEQSEGPRIDRQSEEPSSDLRSGMEHRRSLTIAA